MTGDSESIDHQLLVLLQAVRDTHDDSARASLNELLRNDATARAAMARLLVDEQALASRLRDDSIVSLLEPVASAPMPALARSTAWLSWQPLSAAAAGMMLGVFCTSLVHGFVAQQAEAVNQIMLDIFDPAFEDDKQVLEDGVPNRLRQWGMDSAAIVAAENDVLPLEGSRMLRLEPIPRDKEVKNHTSRVYQVLDLRSLPPTAHFDNAEVKATASFFATKHDVSSRYMIRAVALNEAPETAVKDFWSKTENDDVVSTSQRFDAVPGEKQWQTFSLKMPLPREAKTLVLIFGAVPPQNESDDTTIHYIDDVQVSLLTSKMPQR